MLHLTIALTPQRLRLQADFKEAVAQLRQLNTREGALTQLLQDSALDSQIKVQALKLYAAGKEPQSLIKEFEICLPYRYRCRYCGKLDEKRNDLSCSKPASDFLVNLIW